MIEDQDIDFYQILEKSNWKNILPKASGYPDYRIDGYKSLIDEKGLKRENLYDPEFDISESVLQIKDDNGQIIAAPTDYKRIAELDFKQNGFKLFSEV